MHIRYIPELFLPMPKATWKIYAPRATYGEVNIGWDAGILEKNRPYFCVGMRALTDPIILNQIRTVRHTINVFNTTHTLPGFNDLTIDQALVYQDCSYRMIKKLISGETQGVALKIMIGSCTEKSTGV